MLIESPVLIDASAFSVLSVINWLSVSIVYINGMCACEHGAYWRLAESSWEASGA